MKLTREQIERARIDFERLRPSKDYYQRHPNTMHYRLDDIRHEFKGFLAAVEFYQPQSIFSKKEGGVSNEQD